MTAPNIHPRTQTPSPLVLTLFPKYSFPLFPQSIDNSLLPTIQTFVQAGTV